MKQKIIIGGAVLLLILVLILMGRDLMRRPGTIKTNPYELNLDEYKKIDSSLYCYHEVHRFTPIIDRLDGLAIDKDDNLYLTGLQKVMIYNKNLEFQKGFKINAEAKNIAITPKSEILLGVSDHVERWDMNGQLIQSWKRYNDRSVITSIALNDEAVYVADAGNRVVLKYDYSGKLLMEIGRKDTVEGIPGFVIPSPYFDVAIGHQGELWVVNPGLHELESFDDSGRMTSFWDRTSMQLDGFSGCCNPSHIAILSDGSFVTSEKGIVRVKIHAPTGDFRCIVAGPEAFDDGTHGIDLAVNSHDDIFLIVPNKNEVRIYKKNEN